MEQEGQNLNHKKRGHKKSQAQHKFLETITCKAGEYPLELEIEPWSKVSELFHICVCIHVCVCVCVCACVGWWMWVSVFVCVKMYIWV